CRRPTLAWVGRLVLGDLRRRHLAGATTAYRRGAAAALCGGTASAFCAPARRPRRRRGPSSAYPKPRWGAPAWPCWARVLVPIPSAASLRGACRPGGAARRFGSAFVGGRRVRFRDLQCVEVPVRRRRILLPFR